MASFLLTPGAPIRALDANGDPVSGAKLYVFDAGTSTPLTVYSDLALSSAHATPVVADSNGYFPAIYFTGPDTLKVRIDDASDNALSTLDHIAGLPTSTTGAADTSFTATARIAADDVQEAIEDVDGVLEKTQAGFDRITATGSGNAYALNTNVTGYAAYATGDTFVFEANHASTGAATLNVESLGAKTLKVKTAGSKTDVASGDIQAGHILRVRYDGTDFVVTDHWRPRATKAQAEAGTAEGLYLDPLRTRQAIAAQAGMFPITRATASGSAALEFTGFDSTKYSSYILRLSNLIPATDAVSLRLRLSNDAGATYRTGAADYVLVAAGASTGAQIIVSDAGTTIGNAAGEHGISGTIWIHGPHSASVKTEAHADVTYFTSPGGFARVSSGGAVATAEDNDAAQLSFSTGNITSGYAELYGVRIAP